MKARARKVLFGALILFAVGTLYTVIVKTTGLSVPCPIRRVTGLLCPGCGVSWMCLALMRLDFSGAFRANPVLLCLLPLMLLTAGRMIYVYIRYGRTRERITQFSIYGMIAALLVFGVLRNIL